MTKKIIGIGNAIVDILCKVDDDFLSRHKLVKGSMSLIDETMVHKLAKLRPEKVTSGGSVGNTIATLGQLGCKSVLIGKVACDEFGQKFVKELEKTGAKFLGKTTKSLSACSFVLVTPDAQRTMCTFLGCASEISENDLDEKIFADAAILYLEGYLWDGNKTSAALKKAIKLAKKNNVKIAFSLSDSFCVERHKKDFLQLVEKDLDILFANEAEGLKLSGMKEFSAEKFADLFSKNSKLTAVLTRSAKSCFVFSDKKTLEISPKDIEKLIDTTGAGDAFAAGFLHGLMTDCDLEKSTISGHDLATKIIQKFGARFEQNEI